MAKRSVTIELDEETLHDLAALGPPIAVIARLASAAADGVRRPGQPKREQTNQSLRLERDKSDVAIAKERVAIEEQADDVVRIARGRADQVVQTARANAGGEQGAQASSTEASSRRARTVLEAERSDADAVLQHERAERKSDRAGFLAVERGATDQDLTGERAYADGLIGDQREANEQMIVATLRARDLMAEADAAKERAEESERELLAVAEFREMFIGIVGHDLRNPLGSIRMATGLMLRRGQLDEATERAIAIIVNSSQRMTRMITQLLDLTRSRLGGGFPLEAEPTDLRDVCQRVVEEFEAPTRLEMTGDLTGTWDADRLAEVLSNIAGNAIEHAAPGTPVVVRAHADGDEVVVEVCNQGNPIPAEVLPFIFEPFRRAKQQQRSPAGNLGLGLYIAQQIVLSHGGTLAARSADGRTTFVMRLPRRHPPAVPPR